MADPNTNPTNLNSSPSPNGDGVQSSSAEKTAAGDKGNAQAAQQRINQATRREQGENVTGDDKKPGGPAGIVQSPGEVIPAAGPDPVEVAEQVRKDKYEAERKIDNGELSQATIDEMNAGKAAIKGSGERHAAELGERKIGQPTNPVDETSTASKG